MHPNDDYTFMIFCCELSVPEIGVRTVFFNMNRMRERRERERERKRRELMYFYRQENANYETVQKQVY